MSWFQPELEAAWETMLDQLRPKVVISGSQFSSAYPSPPFERLVFYCRTISASTAPKDVLPLRICANYCAPCQPLLRSFSGWIRSRLLPRHSTDLKGPVLNRLRGTVLESIIGLLPRNHATRQQFFTRLPSSSSLLSLQILEGP